MAVVEAMGLLGEDGVLVHEGLCGAPLTGRVRGRTMVGDIPAVMPEIEGSAWVTGEHAFTVDERDPLGWGFDV
jgi:proline racemase